MGIEDSKSGELLEAAIAYINAWSNPDISDMGELFNTEDALIKAAFVQKQHLDWCYSGH